MANSFWSRLTRKPRPQYSVHSLRDNYNLTPQQYARCIALVGGIQRLYDNAPAYTDRHGLDRSVALPGNEWASIVPVEGLNFRTAYNDINYLRLWAPFIGFHLPILDRLDRRRFPNDGGEAFLAQLAQGIPEDIVDVLDRRLDIAERLEHLAPEYQKYVRNVPKQYVTTIPRMFGEIGIEIDGRVINPDALMAQSRINGLLASGVIAKLHGDISRRGRARVVEVGAGYGALAYALKSIFQEKLEYIVIDLPSSMYYATLYLSQLFDGEGCYLLEPGDQVPEQFNFLFVANYLAGTLAESLGPIDLAINTMSFCEMSAAQVEFYAELFLQLLRPDGVAFDENGVFLTHHVDSDAILGKLFPFRKRVSSTLAIDRNWQSVWSSRYISEIHDRSDAFSRS